MITADPVLDRALEHRIVPDRALRSLARTSCRLRLRQEQQGGDAGRDRRREALLAELSSGPIAESTGAANDQHYEVPAAFFELVLGPRLKYSSGWWDQTTADLGAAEEAMLARTTSRAGIASGQEVLELGCGWGSLTLWMLEHHPDLRVTAVSNSLGQRRFIERRARELGVADRLRVVTCDINRFEPDRRFDRVVSVEMFEHLRNLHELFARIRSWLEPDGRLFTHVFSHRELAYRYRRGWMARNFFTGGTMPSHDLFDAFADDLAVEQRWIVDGTHYARTAGAWLANLDARRDEAEAVLALDGAPDPAREIGRWRLFLIGCEELWGFDHGKEWQVSHHLLAPC